MKKVIIFLLVLLGLYFVLTAATGCATPNMKRDCRGVKHYRLSNGIYL